MGSPGMQRQQRDGASLRSSAPIIAFDFDGTLTTKDTFLAFLRWRSGQIGYWRAVARLTPALISFVRHRNVERLKAQAVGVFLRGAPMTTLKAEAREFAATAAPALLRPDALQVWRRHQAEGARMVIVTASPEAVIAPFAHGLGADLLIGTRLEIDAEGRLTGALDGPNCRGQEKVNRLNAVFGPALRLKAAYGDTDGDIEMLGIADQPSMRLFVGVPARGTNRSTRRRTLL
jgi:phosphatidylglycerophosphatase C